MIDTVCLLIPEDQIAYLAEIANWDLNAKTAQYTKHVRNPSKSEKESGGYFPRLTRYHRGFLQKASIRIEFSTPKLLFLNNLDELEDSDFPRVIAVLQDRLETMGIVVNKIVLENASMSSIHFSKNILLQDNYTASHLISEMNKIDLRKSFDFAKTRFVNDGQSLYAHTTSHQLVIYDKMADLGKDRKRAVDKDQTYYQKTLFAELDKTKELQEVIRLEVRLSQKQKMNKVLTDLGYPKNPVFKNVFNAEMSKKVVGSYWNKLIKDRNLGLFSISMNSKNLLQTLLQADTGLKPKQAIYLLGLHTLSKDEGGMRQLRSMVSKRSHDRTWYRIINDTQRTNELINKNNLKSWVTQIDKALAEYKPYKHKELSTEKVEM